MTVNKFIDSDICHDSIVKDIKPELGFKGDLNFSE